MGASIDDVRNGVLMLRARFEAAGRDPGELRVRAAAALVRADRGFDLAASVAATQEVAEAGATDVIVPMSAFVRETSDVRQWLDDLVGVWGTTW